MAISFRSSASVDLSGTATSITINKPTGTAQGDVMVAAMYTNQSFTVTPPTGWTATPSTPPSVTSNQQCATFSKIAGASEPTSYTFSTGGNLGPKCGLIATYTGNDQTTQPDVASSDSTGTGATATAPSITTVTDGAMLLCVFTVWDSSTAFSTPSGMTSRVQLFSGGNPLALFDEIISSHGSTGSKSTTSSSPANANGWTGTSIALRPAASTSTPSVDGWGTSQLPPATTYASLPY